MKASIAAQDKVKTLQDLQEAIQTGIAPTEEQLEKAAAYCIDIEAMEEEYGTSYCL